MRFKKALAVFLTVVCFLSLCSCKKNPENSSFVSEGNVVENFGRNYITLLYSASDTFNPYTAKTDINRQLCKLLYEPLVKLDNEFNPVYSIAKEIKTEGTVCTVALRDINFSDGTALTADDVVYSYNLAKGETSVYAARLYEVVAISAVNRNTVEFKLSKADAFFENLLSFPIIKANSESITNSDSVLQPPIGSGRYKVSDDKQSLTVNTVFYQETPAITEIKLINAPDSESVSHYVEIGASDMYYSEISDGNILRMSGKKLDINLNNLVYIGINQNYGALTENYIRQALSAGIDRKKICQNSFYNNAVPATGFFNPVWEKTKSVQNIQIEADYEITIENLEKIGYNKLDSKSNRVNQNGTKLEFTLLVNSENRIRVAAAQQIAAQLKDYGINITVVEKAYSAYVESLRNGNFQLFLGEVKLTENMDISSLVCEGGSAAYGLAKSVKGNDENQSEEETVAEENIDAQETQQINKSQQVVDGLYAGNNTIADVAAVLQTEMPFIPVCYRTGILFCNENIKNVDTPSASDIFNSIELFAYKAET